VEKVQQKRKKGKREKKNEMIITIYLCFFICWLSLILAINGGVRCMRRGLED